MKSLLAALVLSAALAPAAFATEPFARSDNFATVGAQFNDQRGYFNGADNRAGLAQSGVAKAGVGFPWYGAGGVATATNSAGVGAQVNMQHGGFNHASNDVWMQQRSAAFAGGPGFAAASNTATVGAQLNIQSGEGNVASNSAVISQSSEAVSEDVFAPVR
jgi:hypothetical protein